MLKISFLFLTLFAFIGCQEKTKIEVNTQSNEVEIVLEYAKHFKVYKNDTSYRLEIINPTTALKESEYFIQKSSSRRLLSMDASFNGMLSVLKSTNNLIGISNINYVYDSIIKVKAKKGEIQEFGGENEYSIEKLIQFNITTILYSGFEEKFPNENKLKKLNIELIPIYNWRETHPLGKAEWIKVIGIITGNEKEAFELFNQVVKSYKEVHNLASKTQTSPTLLSGNIYGDVWFAPSGESYVAQLFQDANSNYIYKNTIGTGSLSLSMEAILQDNATTEIWLNPGFQTKDEITKNNPHVANLKCFNRIYGYSGNMKKYFELSAIQPHLLLSDYIHIFHPEITEISSLYFYQEVN